jgi:hypothetical protein
VEWLSLAQQTQSPNGIFSLAWYDPGTISKSTGKYALFQQHELLLVGSLRRPEFGKVADNGVFILNNCISEKQRHAKFHAFGKSGEILIERLFKAHLWKNGLSQDGRFAVCQTCNAENKDGAILTLFDLGAKTILWSLRPPDWGIDSFEFDVENETLYLIYGNRAPLSYSLVGQESPTAAIE